MRKAGAAIPSESDKLIGGEIELSIGELSEFLSKAKVGAGYLREGGNRHFVQSGRSALRIIAGYLKSKNRKRILLPSYLCPSVSASFLSMGFAVDYYRISGKLHIDIEDLESRIKRNLPDAALVINYFGFPADISIVRNVLPGETALIEDCAQGSLQEFDPPAVGLTGDFIITSYRKYLPVPDGGLLLDNAGCDLQIPLMVNQRFSSMRLTGKLLQSVFRSEGMKDEWMEAAYLKLFSGSEAELDAGEKPAAISSLSRMLLAGIDPNEVAHRRRRNFEHLLEHFQREPVLQKMKPLFEELPERVSPQFFPLIVQNEKREALKRALYEKRVYCAVHWKLPEGIDPQQFPESHRLSNSILGLPIDQRYDTADMELILGKLQQALKEMGLNL